MFAIVLGQLMLFRSVIFRILVQFEVMIIRWILRDTTDRVIAGHKKVGKIFTIKFYLKKGMKPLPTALSICPVLRPGYCPLSMSTYT